MKKFVFVLALAGALSAAAFGAPGVTDIEKEFAGAAPAQWGERVPGVITRVPVGGQKIVFLTFDACGGPYGSGYDARLIAYLRREKISATLFLNSRWIDANPAAFAQLARDPLFSVQNHGTSHRPLSVTGRAAWKIAGTASPRAVYDEIMICHNKIAALAGKAPRFFRSGTAYYDDAAVKIAARLGCKIAGFDVLGDGGARFTAAQIEAAARRIRPGSIVIYHMNQPRKATCDGLMRVVPLLRAAGWQFARLDEYL